MSTKPWHTGRVVRIENENYNTRRFFIEVHDMESFSFKAGQFVTLDLPINEQKNKRWRSYSIASWPDGSNIFELLIVLLEGGTGTHYLFNELKVGSELVFKGPLGFFTLDPPIEKDIFFICTGTGIAPFRSMLHEILLNKTPHKELYLIFGCRTKEDLMYYDEFKKLEKQLDHFHYLPTLSREKWEGRTGYVHSIYQEICQEKMQAEGGGDTPHPASFYLCGWKAMIDDARSNITQLGFDRKAIHLELYG